MALLNRSMKNYFDHTERFNKDTIINHPCFVEQLSHPGNMESIQAEKIILLYLRCSLLKWELSVPFDPLQRCWLTMRLFQCLCSQCNLPQISQANNLSGFKKFVSSSKITRHLSSSKDSWVVLINSWTFEENVSCWLSSWKRINGSAILLYQLSKYQHHDFITGCTMECMLLSEIHPGSYWLRLNTHST